MSILILLVFVPISISMAQYMPFKNATVTTNLMRCVCSVCEPSTTIGFLFENSCFYINVNDRFHYNNDIVNQFSVGHVNNDVGVADSIVARLTGEMYTQFKYPYINLRWYESAVYTVAVSPLDLCPKLDIRLNKISNDEDNGCTAEPSIIKTEQYDVLYSRASEIFHEVSYQNCTNRENGILINSGENCMFWASGSTRCNVAFIRDIHSYKAFEKFVVETMLNEINIEPK